MAGKIDENIPLEINTFYIDNTLCGIDIGYIREINKDMKLTRVPGSPSYVMGVLNLRGEIVSIIDLDAKFGLGEAITGNESRNVVVKFKEESIGLRVDCVSDVYDINRREVEPPPANVRGIEGKYFEGVFKTEDKLIAILNINEVLKMEESQSS
ncbi:MAG: chemotaxis protein CheW [Thermodesulfobacteriota bacterium]|nr:chemotaxis protein CheW [Thermodesulfobacteriota bacterium]